MATTTTVARKNPVATRTPTARPPNSAVLRPATTMARRNAWLARQRVSTAADVRTRCTAHIHLTPVFMASAHTSRRCSCGADTQHWGSHPLASDPENGFTGGVLAADTPPQYQTRCMPGLQCVNTNPMISDAPGKCKPKCPTTWDKWGNCVKPGCTTWFDGCNTCHVNGKRLTSCTEKRCYRASSTFGCKSSGSSSSSQQTQMCPASSRQMCRMRCRTPNCPAGQCAMRQGNCCNFTCKASSGH